MHTYDRPGSYTVQLTATGQNGCADISLPQIIEILNSGLFTPTAFSPNGDGNNDLYAISAGALESFSIIIYDRWGRKMMESADTEFSWDGTLNGNPAPEGSYVFTIKGTTLEGKLIERMGSIMLIRKADSLNISSEKESCCFADSMFPFHPSLGSSFSTKKRFYLHLSRII